MGLGIFETARWSTRKNDFEQQVGPKRDNPLEMGINCGADDPQRGGPGCADLYQKMQSARTLAIVGYAVGAGLAVGSVVLFSVSSPSPSPSSTAGRRMIACAPSWPAVGATCQLSF